jgi:thioredoxin-related protein
LLHQGQRERESWAEKREIKKRNENKKERARFEEERKEEKKRMMWLLGRNGCSWLNQGKKQRKNKQHGKKE